MKPGGTSYQLQLQRGVNYEGSLFRVKKGDSVRFTLGASLQGQSLTFFTNHPAAPETPFVRANFRQLSFRNPSPFRLDTFDLFAELCVVQAGSFNFELREGSETVTQGFLVVEPELRILGEVVPVTGLVLQTYLSKSLGPVSGWDERLEIAAQSGYNMVHLTPVQELGRSLSSYCLRDQLKVNPSLGSSEEVEAAVKRLEERGVLTLTDLVYNHTANESPWLQAAPQCAYNLDNSPHLRPAYLLDRAVWQLTLDIEAGRFEGIDTTLSEHWQLGRLHDALWANVEHLRLHEYFLAHVDDQAEKFKAFLTREIKAGRPKEREETALRLSTDYRRLNASVNFKDAAAELYWTRPDGPGKLEAAVQEFRVTLGHLNDQAYFSVQQHLSAAVANVLANAEYRFLNPSGPCYNLAVTVDSPIMWTYFLHPDETVQLDGAEALMDSKMAPWIMAHNGWVMNDDPLHNFAKSDSNVYLRRELIPWGDSVKLRYGDKPEDNPVLWEHMRKYTAFTARVFHGGRLDNCHSTPLHVAQYMMDAARAIRPDFFVIAELFTSRESFDNIFINKLGIGALVREAMSAGDSHEEGRLVYRYGGVPVGSFAQPQCRPLVQSVAGAVFYDVTHDNPSMVEQRSLYDLLPSAALVLWADCSAGSTRGFDEAVPHNVDVVTETRLYGRWGHEVNAETGLISAKASLNKLHQWMAKEGFTEVFVDQVSYDVVTVTRHCPRDRRSAILVVNTAFHSPCSGASSTTRPLPIEGDIVEILFEGTTIISDGPNFTRSSSFINGDVSLSVRQQDHIPVSDSQLVSLSARGDELLFSAFPPGCAIAVLVRPSADADKALNSMVTASGSAGLLRAMMDDMSLADLNWLLYRAGPEESVSVPNGGLYHVPGHGDLNYAGLQGVVSLLSDIRPHNDLGHPLCDNLRRGDWLTGFTCTRLLKHEGTKRLGSWLLDSLAKPLGRIPHYLKPCYFDMIITQVYAAALESCWQRMGMLKASSLARGLAMCSIQFCGQVGNAALPPLSKKLEPAPGKPGGKKDTSPLTLAAGFPHFSEGIWRNWGRDTFIALPGLLLCCSRWDDARRLILGYAGCLRHGLVPNLLGTAFVEEHGPGPRFNARDAVWFWLAAIRAFVERAPAGEKLLADPVLRLFPPDVEAEISAGRAPQNASLAEMEARAVEMPLQDVIQEALSRHAADDIEFVEWNAGPKLDEMMSAEGFHVRSSVDWVTGFPVGGNARNCGTWMDKMGSSDWANNRGTPATPRDGSAVELVGLCYYVIDFLEKMHKQGHYRHPGVSQPDGKTVSWQHWKDLLQKHFEERFWIPGDTEDPSLRVNRGVYRDSVGSSHKYTDNQFRPNFLVTMALAPNLFTPTKAWRALQRVGAELLGPLGVRTLHPADLAYRGHYDNADDSADFHVAHGFNYHQGPEWLWPVGFYLRAVLNFAKEQEETERAAAIQHVQAVLGRHQEALLGSHWRSLPELTNANGQHCAHSCMAQAWSAGCLMESLNDLLLLSSS